METTWIIILSFVAYFFVGASILFVEALINGPRSIRNNYNDSTSTQICVFFIWPIVMIIYTIEYLSEMENLPTPSYLGEKLHHYLKNRRPDPEAMAALEGLDGL